MFKDYRKYKRNYTSRYRILEENIFVYLSISFKHSPSRQTFFFYMSLLFIVGVIHTSNNQSENDLSIFVTSTANYTEDPSTFNTAYLLHGLNGVLCLFLFALIFHLCKKSLSSKRANGNCMTLGENNVQDESQKQDQQGRRQSYDTISDSAIIVQDYRSLESEYDEIDVKSVSYTHLTLPTICSV